MPASIIYSYYVPTLWPCSVTLCDCSVWFLPRWPCKLCLETMSNLCDGLEICFSACLGCFTLYLSSVFFPLSLCRSLIMANFACANSLFLYQLCNCALQFVFILLAYVVSAHSFLPSVILLYAQSASARTVPLPALWTLCFFFSILFHTINLRTVVACPL